MARLTTAIRAPWAWPLVLAVVLRFWGLGEVPAGLTDDEARLGHGAWSLARTGHHGGVQTWPFRPDPVLARPLGNYATAASVAILGPTPFAVRLPAAVAGAVAVVPAAMIGQGLFGTRAGGVSAALLLAASPWHLSFTRTARDGAWLVLGLLVMVAGILRAGREGDSSSARTLATAAVGAAVATLGDPDGAVASVATAIAVALARGPQGAPGRVRGAAPALAALVTVAALAAPFASVRGGVSIGPTSDAREDASAQSARRLAANSGGVVGALQAPWAVLAREALASHASHYDLTYLFTRGDGDRRNHSAGAGQLSLLDAPLAVGGALLALAAIWRPDVRAGRPNPWMPILAWLLVAPLPAALAVSSADAARSIAMVPALALLEAGAVSAAWPRLVRRRVTVEAYLALACSVIAWAVAAAVHDPAEAGRPW